MLHQWFATQAATRQPSHNRHTVQITIPASGELVEVAAKNASTLPRDKQGCWCNITRCNAASLAVSESCCRQLLRDMAYAWKHEVQQVCLPNLYLDPKTIMGPISQHHRKYSVLLAMLHDFHLGNHRTCPAMYSTLYNLSNHIAQHTVVGYEIHAPNHCMLPLYIM